MLAVASHAQVTFNTTSSSRNLENAKMAAQLSQLKDQADDNTDRLDNEVKDHAKAMLASCSGDNKIAWNGSVWSCTSETDPTVYSFAQTQLPDCGSSKILTGDGTSLSCVDSAGLSGFEIDPTVYDFAKAALPDCGADKILTGDGSNLSCVSGTSLTGFESDPSVKSFAKANLPTCDPGEVLTGDGTSMACVGDSGFGFTEADPQVGTLTSGKWCSTDGSTIDCTSDAPTGGADNLGDHAATQDLAMGSNVITFPDENADKIKLGNGYGMSVTSFGLNYWAPSTHIWTSGGSITGGGSTIMTANASGLNMAGKNIQLANNIEMNGALTSTIGTLRDANGGYVRTYGNTGWYNGTHVGGWYMQDATYVRSYSNKSVYTGGAMRADAGFYVGSTPIITSAGAVSTASLSATTGGIGSLTVTSSMSVLAAAPQFPNINEGPGGSYACFAGAAHTMRLNSGGCNSSDKRLKKNIEPYQTGLDEIMKLNPVTYNWKEEWRGKGREPGLLAQDVLDVIPEVVTGTGKKLENGEMDYYGVSYIKLTVPLVNAVKELKDRNDELRRENAEFRQRLEKLEARMR